MSDIGRLAIVLGFIVAIWGIVASVAGALRRDDDLVASGSHAAYAFSGLVGIAVALLSWWAAGRLIARPGRLHRLAGPFPPPIKRARFGSTA